MARRICRRGRRRERWPRSEIRERTDRHYAHLPLAWIVESLNAVLLGWGGVLPLRKVRTEVRRHRRHVNQRLAMLAGTKHGLRGRNQTTRFTHDWTSSLGVHRLNGTIRPTTAYASR